jgi:hypothetical protein
MYESGVEGRPRVLLLLKPVAAYVDSNRLSYRPLPLPQRVACKEEPFEASVEDLSLSYRPPFPLAQRNASKVEPREGGIRTSETPNGVYRCGICTRCYY